MLLRGQCTSAHCDPADPLLGTRAQDELLHMHVGPVLVDIQWVEECPRDLAERQSLIWWVYSRAWDSEFLTIFQMMPRLFSGPYFEEH